MSRFYIGQKVVAIKDHSQGIFKKGDEFTVLSLHKGCCSNLVDIGINGIGKTRTCFVCMKTHLKEVSNWLFAERCFAPIELSETTFEDVIAILNKGLILN